MKRKLWRDTWAWHNKRRTTCSTITQLEAELASLEKQLCYKKTVVSDDRLLSLFDSAPEGPIELDTSLIYGPSDQAINQTSFDEHKVVVRERPEGKKPREEITREEEEMLECTFAPQTGRPPRNGPYAQLRTFPIEERLFHQAASRRRRETTDRILREREESLQAACTFHPSLITHPEKHLKAGKNPLV